MVPREIPLPRKPPCQQVPPHPSTFRLLRRQSSSHNNPNGKGNTPDLSVGLVCLPREIKKEFLASIKSEYISYTAVNPKILKTILVRKSSIVGSWILLHKKRKFRRFLSQVLLAMDWYLVRAVAGIGDAAFCVATVHGCVSCNNHPPRSILTVHPCWEGFTHDNLVQSGQRSVCRCSKTKSTWSRFKTDSIA